MCENFRHLWKNFKEKFTFSQFFFKKPHLLKPKRKINSLNRFILQKLCEKMFLFANLACLVEKLCKL